MHNDLNVRDLLLDNDNVLWVDFELAGPFPLWFEYLGMKFAVQKDGNPES
jgi:thiamine kinase-like enzyme